MNLRPITDADIYGEVIHPWEDAHPEPGPDEDSLRAYFADDRRQDWPARCGWLAGYGGVAAAVLVGAVLALWVVWAVTQ